MYELRNKQIYLPTLFYLIITTYQKLNDVDHVKRDDNNFRVTRKSVHNGAEQVTKGLMSDI